MISSRDLNAPTTQPRKCRSHTIMPRILPRSGRALGVKSEQLLTQGKIFEDDILAGPECTNNPAEEVPEPYDHAQNLTGTLSIELGAKSLILRVYDVLMNDKGESPP